MSLSRNDEHKIDSQLVQVYNGVTALQRFLATLEESIEAIYGEGSSGAADRVAPIASAAERAAIAAQLETWANTLRARWNAQP